jgi:hypothetical protein
MSFWDLIPASAAYPSPPPIDDPRFRRVLPLLAGDIANDPFAMAAARMRQSVQPWYGRSGGVATRVLQSYLPHVAHGLATLPARAIGAAGELQRTGEYNPGPVLETAMMMTGIPQAPRGALGSSARRPTRLPMDNASRMARADAMGFRRDTPIEYGRAPAGERIAAAAIDVDGRIFTGINHAEAIQRAEAELKTLYPQMTSGPIEDGFVTTSGRYISRWEANDISQRAAQGATTGPFAKQFGLASEDIAMAQPAATRRSAVETGATAPGLPGGRGIWGYRRSPEPASNAQGVLWARAQRPLVLGAHGLSDSKIQAILQSAWKEGRDAVILEGYTSPGGRSGDVFIVRDRAQLRDPGARFDPKKRGSPDLLAGLAAAGFLALPSDTEADR